MQRAGRYHPVKRAYQVIQVDNNGDFDGPPKGGTLLVYRYPIAIISAPKFESLQLIYFNLRTVRPVHRKTIRIAFHDYRYPDPILIRYNNEHLILMKSQENLLLLLSLKNHTTTLQSIFPAASWVGFCYMNDQILTWTYESRELTFWQLFQEKPIATMELPDFVSVNHAQLNSRKVLILQRRDCSALILIDVVNKCVLKELITVPCKLLRILSTERFIYLQNEIDYNGVICYRLYNYWIDGGLNLLDKRLYEQIGDFSQFLCLDGGGVVSVTDERRACLVGFEKIEIEEKFLSNFDNFDARKFLYCPNAKLVAALSDEQTIWIWKY